MPAWVDTACEDYQRRLPREIGLTQLSLPLSSRKTKEAASAIQRRDSDLILSKLKPGAYNIALDEKGALWSSIDWSKQLQSWMLNHPHVNLIIGGPDGLSAECSKACQQQVSLGRMTMPHALIRVILLEQLYRAWTILQGHPYHRA